MARPIPRTAAHPLCLPGHLGGPRGRVGPPLRGVGAGAGGQKGAPPCHEGFRLRCCTPPWVRQRGFQALPQHAAFPPPPPTGSPAAPGGAGLRPIAAPGAPSPAIPQTSSESLSLPTAEG
eukprot:5671264-Alexandrium_andersonii.AAC.1